MTRHTETHHCPTCWREVELRIDPGEVPTHDHPGAARQVVRVMDECACGEHGETPLTPEDWTRRLTLGAWDHGY